MAEIDFEAEGLLAEVEGEAREARLALLGDLAEDGVPLEELKRAVEQDRLALLPVERALGAGGKYTARELAETVGIDVDLLLRQQRALGLPVLDIDERVHSEDELEAARRIKTFLDAGLPEAEMTEVTRVIGIAMSQVAAASRALIGDAFLEEGLTERDLAQRYATAAREMSPLVGEVMTHIHRMHLREQIRHDVIGRAELVAGELPGASEIAVCFADLVDFTRMGERMAPEDVGSVAGKLNEMASDIASGPVRLVKLIGDAAMLAGPDAKALVEATLGLVEAASEEEDFPELRAGVAYGPALARGGDWYGRPVNLASRITGFARPSSVLATADVKGAAGDGFSWSRVGRRHFKGIKGSVELHRVRRKRFRGGGGGSGGGS